MKKSSIITLIILVLALILISSSVYVVNEDEVAIVENLGKITAAIIDEDDIDDVMRNLEGTNMEHVKIIPEKGLHFKIPFIQSVHKYDSKYLTYISRTETINTKDRRELEFQMYAQYRIVDPVTFYRVVKTEREINKKMNNRVYPVVKSSANTLLFQEFFDKALEEVITLKQKELNEQLLNEFGIYVSDIGVNKKKFPMSNVASIESKMSKEIEKESEKLIAEGDSEYLQAKAKTDRQKKEVLAEAIEESAIIKAEADAEALRIYQESLKKDLEFYKFIQRMDIYKNLKDTTIFVDKNNDLLEYINGY